MATSADAGGGAGDEGNSTPVSGVQQPQLLEAHEEVQHQEGQSEGMEERLQEKEKEENLQESGQGQEKTEEQGQEEQEEQKTPEPVEVQEEEKHELELQQEEKKDEQQAEQMELESEQPQEVEEPKQQGQEESDQQEQEEPKLQQPQPEPQMQQPQQDVVVPAAGQRDGDGSQPQVRKDKSRQSRPAAAAGPRLDIPPKPSEPPVDNLIPIRLDIDSDGQRYKDLFTWNADDPDTEIAPFVRRLVKDMNLPIVFAHYIAQSMQTQISEYRASDNQRVATEERVQIIKLDLRVNRTLIHDQFLWDVNNGDSDPEKFAIRLCQDLELEDPEIVPAIAVSIREQIHEINKQISSSGRDTRISKKVRRERGVDYSPSSNPPTTALNLMRRPNNKISVMRRRNEWDAFEPVVEQLTDTEMEALYAREERNGRLKKQQAEREDAFGSRYVRM